MEERLGEMRKERRERKRIEKGSHCFFNSSGLELKHKNQAYRMHYKKKKCHSMKQYAKICAIGEQNVIN